MVLAYTGRLSQVLEDDASAVPRALPLFKGERVEIGFEARDSWQTRV